jgi:hypothetical protein
MLRRLLFAGAMSLIVIANIASLVVIPTLIEWTTNIHGTNGTIQYWCEPQAIGYNLIDAELSCN